jgi:chromosome segregation ATPase
MDIPKFSKSDPLIVLLNEVEILLAQTRLMELHVKRAESLTGDRIARLQEEYQSELAALRSALAKSDEALAAQKSVLAGTPELRERIELLEEQLRAERQILEERDAEILRANSDIARLQDHVGQLESAGEWAQAKFEAAARAREGLEIDLSSLRASVEEAQSRSQSTALATAEQQRDLQTQLAKANARAEQAAAALDRAQSENVALHSRLAELELVGQEAERRAAEEREQLRLGFETDLGELRSCLTAREQALQEHRSAAHESESRLRGNLLNAQKEVEEKRALAASGAERLGAALERATALEQRAAELETANAALATQLRRLDDERRSQADDIETLRHQVAAQEQALVGRQEAVTAVELALHAKIQTLQQDLANSRREIEERNRAVENAQAASDTLRRDHEAEVAALRASLNALDEDENRSEAARRAVQETRHRGDEGSRELAARLSLKEQDEKRLEAKIAELQMQLAEKQVLAERRAAEITDLKAAASRFAEKFAREQSAEDNGKAARIKDLESAAIAQQGHIEDLEKERRAERQSLEDTLALEQQKTAELSRRVVQLENRDREAELRLKNHEQETASAIADAAALCARVQQLEALAQEQERTFKSSAEAEQKRLEAELAAVQEELRDKAWTLARQQAAFENLALAHKNQLQKLESKIDEQQHAFESQGRELAQARAHAQSLERRDARGTGLQKGEETMKEHVAMKTDDVDQEAAKQSEKLAEPAAPSGADRALHDEIARLRQEAQEKNQILQNRNDELVRVKIQLDQLHERLAQLESSSQEKTSSTVEAERVRTEFQAQLVLLQAELSQKQWALEERQAKARIIEQSLRQELDSLRRQLAAKEAAEQAGRDFLHGGPGANHDRDEVFALNGTNDAATGAFASQRRWNRGFGWKRRWRS